MKTHFLSWNLVDVLEQAMSNSQILYIFYFLQPRPLDHAAHALNKGTEWRTGTSVTYFCVDGLHPPLNPSNNSKKHAHIKEVLKKMCVGAHFFTQIHSFGCQFWWGRWAERGPILSGCFKVCPALLLFKNALKTR